MKLSSVLASKSAIFFDYGGTLDAPGTAWKERFFPLYVKHGIKVDFHGFTRAFYRADDSLVAEDPAEMNLTEVVHEQVSRVLGNLGVSDRQAAESIAAEFVSESTANIGRNLPLLKRLGSRFKLGIISNNYGNLEAICRETGLLSVMDVLIDSNRIGAEKPDPAIFEAALKAAGVAPEEAVMVGDNVKRDILGAIHAGIEPVLISDGSLPDDVTVPDGVTVIHNIEELVTDMDQEETE